MTTLAQKLGYFGWACWSALSRREPLCPDCGDRGSELVDRKFFVTELRRCATCRLMYRVPLESEVSNRILYNLFYSQGFTTELPKDETLEQLKKTAFVGSPKDYRRYIELLNVLGAKPGDRLFDFGASWGYGSWQLQRVGFRVEASEISRNRREFAISKLGINMVENPFELTYRKSRRGLFDVFFTSHVLEHVPKPSAVWSLATELLRPGGLFVAVAPNGSAEARQSNPEWRKLWGLVHPNLLDPEYYLTNFQAPQRLVAALPLPPDTAGGWNRGDLVLPAEGAELVFAARL